MSESIRSTAERERGVYHDVSNLQSRLFHPVTNLYTRIMPRK